MMSLVKSELVIIVMLHLFLIKLLVKMTLHFWQQTQNMESQWMYCILRMTENGKIQDFWQNFWQNLHFWRKKDVILGSKILWSLIIIFTCMMMSAEEHGKSQSTAKRSSSCSSRPFSTAAWNNVHKSSHVYSFFLCIIHSYLLAVPMGHAHPPKPAAFPHTPTNPHNNPIPDPHPTIPSIFIPLPVLAWKRWMSHYSMIAPSKA